MFSSSADAQPATGQFEPSSDFQVRAVQSAELDGLAEILADGFHPQDGILGWAYPLLRLGIYEDLRNRLRSTAPNHICMVAIDLSVRATTPGSPYAGNELAGTVEMALRSNELWKSDFNSSNKRVRPQYLYVSNLAVRPTHRRRGVAKQLLLSCERVALSWGFQDLYLHVLENNHQARQLYFKLGYSLYQVDSSWSVWLLGRSRQLFLHKHLAASNP